jgi:hypothetical protein
VSSEKDLARAAFTGRLISSGRVWAVSSDDGFVGATGLDGSSAQPFWSSRESAERMIALVAQNVPGLAAVEIPLEQFVKGSLSDLAEAGVLIGVDWDTDQKGWVFDARELRTQLRALIHRRLN